MLNTHYVEIVCQSERSVYTEECILMFDWKKCRVYETNNSLGP